MAADRHAAAVKAWETRRRAQQGDKKETVQLRGDYGAAASPALPRAKIATVSTAPIEAFLRGDARARWKGQDQAAMSQAAHTVQQALGRIELPGPVADKLDLRVASTSYLGLAGLPDNTLGAYSVGAAIINADKINADPLKAEHATGHEIGHHAHMSKITDAASAEWAKISNHGLRCRVSEYGMQSTTEHFAEVFALYSIPGAREELRVKEPAAHAFMERLWRDKSMWRPDGEMFPRMNRVDE